MCLPAKEPATFLEFDNVSLYGDKAAIQLLPISKQQAIGQHHRGRTQ